MPVQHVASGRGLKRVVLAINAPLGTGGRTVSTSAQVVSALSAEVMEPVTTAVPETVYASVSAIPLRAIGLVVSVYNVSPVTMVSNARRSALAQPLVFATKGVSETAHVIVPRDGEVTAARFATPMSLPTAPLLLPAPDLQTLPAMATVTVPPLPDLSLANVIASPPTPRTIAAPSAPATDAQATAPAVREGLAMGCAHVPPTLHTPPATPVSKDTGGLIVPMYAQVASSTPAPARALAMRRLVPAAVTLVGEEPTAT